MSVVGVLLKNDDSTLRVWDADSHAALWILEDQVTGVQACAFSLYGSRIVSASADSTLRIDGKSVV